MTTPTPASGAQQRSQRTPRKITASSLENAALYYLQRFATSSENLRHVLWRRVERTDRARDDVDRDQATTWIDDIVQRFERSGLLDDDEFARARAQTLHRQGLSSRAIAARLRQKGVGPEAATAALTHLAEGTTDPDLAAACRLARRRRIGPLRSPAERGERHQRDLASLARAGFSLNVARRVLAAESLDDLEALEVEARGEAGDAN